MHGISREIPILTLNLCASSKFGFHRGDITPSDEGKINTIWTYYCLILPSIYQS
ncbi:hypothetical protein AB205_0041590 [Aquarana catesbeiana]|uniref:Uncharacterized protein n=1 Tax=Aquarana catesbeiana TaxID=8400 RepID=A0A2G9RE40_AQUCT|nr:hypothetical protein AB205_0041590 [Aquarana catesbeiana]